MKKTARIFWNGKSQAVRLPKEFRFSCTKVFIEQEGDVVILRPVEQTWTKEFWASLGQLSEDFERQSQSDQHRAELFK